MVDIITVSANLAAWAADAAKPPAVVPTRIAARTVRKESLRRQSADLEETDAESTSPIIQTTTIALDLMNEGNRQPRATLQHALESYADNE